MNLDELRKNKIKVIDRLSKKGVSTRAMAILLYDNDSETAQKKVRALISKLRKKEMESLKAGEQAGEQPQLSEPQPQPEKRSQPQLSEEQPQPEEQPVDETDDTIIEDHIGEDGPVIKHPEIVEKSNASDTVLNWSDEATLARQLVDECYKKARKAYEEKKYEDAIKFMQLITRFLRLSQTARKEYDIDEIKKVLAERGRDAKKEL